VELSDSIAIAPLASMSKDAIRFLLDLGDDEAGEGSWASLACWTGLVGAKDRSSWILLLLRSDRGDSISSMGECKEALSPTCMFDRTYLRGMLKNVATGGTEE